MSLYGLARAPSGTLQLYKNVECIMFQREDPAFVRRVFLQPQARHRPGAAGGASITHRTRPCTQGHAAGHETRAAGCFAVGSQGLNGGFPRATHTVERLAETNPLKNSIFSQKKGSSLEKSQKNCENQRKNRENRPKP